MTDLELFKQFYEQTKDRLGGELDEDEEFTTVSIGGRYGIELRFIDGELQDF